MDRSRTSTGRWIVTALLVATAAVHTVLVVRLWGTSPQPAAVDALLAAAALVVAPFVVLRRVGGATLLAAAVVGAVGVALYLLPGLVAALHGLSYAAWLDPWAFGALLVDALTVRVAVFTLRRAESAPH